MPIYAHGASFEYIWNVNWTLVRRGSMNEHEKNDIHLFLLLTYFIVLNEMKKNVPKCRHEGEGMAIYFFGKVKVEFHIFP